MDKDLIKENILSRIENGKDKIISKNNFYLIKVIWIIFAIILISFLVFLISFVIFSSQQSQLDLLLQFGISGFLNFLLSLPWLLIVITILVLLLLHGFLRGKIRLYKKPALYTFLVILFLIIGGGTILAKTSIHQEIIKLAEDKNLVTVSDTYHKYNHRKARGLYAGKISEIKEENIVIKDQKGKKIIVDINKKSNTKIKAEDSILIFGKDQHGKIKAIKIKQIEEKGKNKMK